MANNVRPESEYSSLVAQCAEQGKALMRLMAGRGQIESLKLFYRPGEKNKSGVLLLARESAPNPENLPLATGESLKSNIAYDAYYQWVYERALRAPVLAV